MSEDFHVTIGGVASSPPEQPGDGIVITDVKTNSPVDEGNNLDFTITYYNAGDDDASLIPIVDVGGTTIDGNFETVPSGGQSSQTLTWSTSVGDAGDYSATVTVGSDSESVSVTVSGDAVFDPTIIDSEVVSQNDTDGTDYYAVSIVEITTS